MRSSFRKTIRNTQSTISSSSTRAQGLRISLKLRPFGNNTESRQGLPYSAEEQALPVMGEVAPRFLAKDAPPDFQGARRKFRCTACMVEAGNARPKDGRCRRHQSDLFSASDRIPNP
jgi:hypothetical protein